MHKNTTLERAVSKLVAHSRLLGKNGKWKMENGKWKMENGKWKMENGKWKMENGKWKIENGKWKIAAKPSLREKLKMKNGKQCISSS